MHKVTFVITIGSVLPTPCWRATSRKQH